MDYNKLKAFRFWDKLDEQIMRSRHSGTRRDSLYPSEASVVAIDPKTKEAEVLGGCMRKSWYRFFGFPKSEETTAKSEYTFAFGNMIEDFIKDLVKQAGIYNNSSVKFWDRSSGVSGEIDIVCDLPVSDNGEYVYTEVKSTWGGQLRQMIHPETKKKVMFEAGSAKGLFDHPEGLGKERHMVKAKPKESNLMQIAIYLYNNREDEKLVGGKLVYMLRDNFNRTEFDIHLQYNQQTKKHDIYVNGEKEERFAVEDIYARYKAIANKINSDILEMRNGKAKEDLTPPERDYDLQYSDQKVEKLFKQGKISKTKYESHKKGFKAGDWQCSYCNYTSLCYKLGKYGNNDVEEAPSDISTEAA